MNRQKIWKKIALISTITLLSLSQSNLLALASTLTEYTVSQQVETTESAVSDEMTEHSDNKGSSEAFEEESVGENVTNETNSTDSTIGGSVNNQIDSTNQSMVDNFMTSFAASASFACFDGIDLGGFTELQYDVQEAQNQSKILTISTAFDDEFVDTNRKITIRINNGLAIDSAPGMVAVNSEKNSWYFDATTLPVYLQGFITAGTYIPDSEIYGYGVKSGVLEYEISPGARNIAFELALYFDIGFGANTADKKTFVDILEVTATADISGVSTVLNSEKIESYSIYGGIYPTLYATNMDYKYVKIGEAFQLDYALSGYLMKKDEEKTYETQNFNQKVLFDEYSVTLEFNKKLGFEKVESSDNSLTTSNLSYTVYSPYGYEVEWVTITFSNIYLDNQKISLVFNPVENIPAENLYPNAFFTIYGKDLSRNWTKAKGYAFPTLDLYQGYLNEQKVYLTKDFSNTLVSNIETNGYFRNTKSIDGVGDLPLGIYYLGNDNLQNVTDQKIRLTFDDSVMGVHKVYLIVGYMESATNVSILTNKGKYMVPNIPSSRNIGNSGSALVDISDYTQDKDEYIKEIIYESTNFLPGSGKANIDYFNATSYENFQETPGVYFGKLLNIPEHKTYQIKVSSVAADIGDFNDISTISSTIYMAISEREVIDFVTSTNLANETYQAGSNILLTHEVELATGNYLYGANTLTKKGFEVYLREDEDLSIDSSSIEIMCGTNTYRVADGSLIPIEAIDNTGNRVIKLVLNNVILGVIDGLESQNMQIKYQLKVKNGAPTKTIRASDLFFIRAIDNTYVRKSTTFENYNHPNRFNVDGSGDTDKMMGTLNSSLSLKIQAQKDFTVTTAANLNDGPWISYDEASDTGIIDLNPNGEAKYQLAVANYSGDTVDGYTALIPIPKSGEKTSLTPDNAASYNPVLHLQKETFSWTTSLLEEINSAGTLNYQIYYATTYEIEKDSPQFKVWDEISNKEEIRMVKIVAAEPIPNNFSETISFSLALTDSAAELNVGKVNIYSARIYREIGSTSGYKPSEPIAIRLKTGVVKGRVFNDSNRNGLIDGDDTGLNGVSVLAYEADSNRTKLLETTTTQTSEEGLEGWYEFNGLDVQQEVDIVFMNPNNDLDSTTHFSPKTEGGSTVTPIDINQHSEGIVQNVLPSGTNYDKIHAGIITPVTITFDAGEGTSQKTIKDFTGHSYQYLPEAELEGHTFLGWSKTPAEDDYDFVPTYNYVIGTSDVTYYAKYQPIGYQLDYNIEGSIETIDVLCNTLVTLKPADPTKVNHTFIGWYDAPTGGKKWDFLEDKMPAKNFTLYAQFKADSYEMSFDSEGKVTKQTTNYNELVMEPTSPNKTGYTFTGWYDATVGGSKWNFEQDTMPASNKTLYAQYKVNSYIANFEVEGVPILTETKDYQASLSAPPAPSKAGYRFTGWLDQSTNQMWNFANHKMPADNLTLQAIFTPENQTITFDSAGGSSVENIVAPTTSVIDIDAQQTSRPGYHFIGWFNGETQVSGSIAMPVEGLHLTARWSAEAQVAFFNTNGGTGVASIVAATDTIFNLDEQITTKAGYHFLGWFDAADQLVSGVQTMPIGGQAYSAKWQAENQTISFDSVGGNEVSDLIAPTDATIDLTAAHLIPNKSGYVFLGWFDHFGNQVSDAIKMPVGGMNLTAKWQDLSVADTWEISATGFIMTIAELDQFKESGKLYSEILERSGAKASAEAAKQSPEILQVDATNLMNAVSVQPETIYYKPEEEKDRTVQY